MERLASLVETFDCKDCIEFFNEQGLITKDEAGYFYPVSNQARSVLRILLNSINKKNIKTIANTYIDKIEKDGNGYRIEGIYYDKVVLAFGGRAGVYKENAFSGRELIKQLDLRCTRTAPALTGVICQGDYTGLKGVRADARITMHVDGTAYTEEGELQYTDYGLSGIPIFNLTSHLPEQYSDVYFEVNVMPDKDMDAVEKIVRDIITRYEEYDVKDAFSGLLNSKLLDDMCVKVLEDTTCVKDISGEMINDIVTYITKNIHVMDKVRDYKSAQIMKGGIALSEIDSHYMSMKHNNLFITGEALDVNGECGGYNLYFAFKSGKTVGDYLNG